MKSRCGLFSRKFRSSSSRARPFEEGATQMKTKTKIKAGNAVGELRD
jgi:hypothetical protein